MKKVIRLLFVLLPAFICAQNSYTDLPGRWRLGLNIGAIWQSSDVKTIPGLGGGFNIEKILNKRSDAFLGFSLGFRYLGGKCFGLNTTPSYGLSNNTALNGTFGQAANYDTTPGYFYANHKTYIQEGNLELKMNFPRLEKKTGIIFHVFGGLGICKYKTWIDALDANGNKYNFSQFQGKQVTQSDLSRVLDGTYETLAQGSSPNGTFCFIPSVGIGLGYRLSRGVALVFEHKISFPLTNLLDGYQYNNNNELTHPNDFYHYTSVGLVFTFYGGHHATQTNSNNTGHSNTTGTQTVTATNTVVANNPPPPVVHPPKVFITYPSNNFNSPYDYTTVNANVQNISNSQQINISQNGYTINHFTFNSYNGTLHFQTFLSQGLNNFVITATNHGGTASQGLTIIYNPIISNTATINNGALTTTTVVTTNTVTTTSSSTVQPVGTATTASTNTVIPHTSTVVTTNTVVPTSTVSPTHTSTIVTTNTVAPTSTVSPTHTSTLVTTNTVAPTSTVSPIHTSTLVTTNTVAPTSTVSPTHTSTLVTTNTVAPTSTVSPIHTSTLVTTNTVSPVSTGTVVETNTTVTTSTVQVNPVPLGKKPVVSFINPSMYSSQEPGDTYNVSASVLNINNSNQVNVTLNGVNFNQFTFNPSSKILNFVVMLQQGYNTITIMATNSVGSDTKSAVINYKPVGKSPSITISNPATSPFTSAQSNLIVSGYVYNVSSSSEISVTSNGAPNTFNYNISTHAIDIPLNLFADVTQVNISAANSFGSDSKGIEIKKIVRITSTDTSENSNNGSNSNLGGSFSRPSITVLSPNIDPFYTNTGVISISANITFVTDANKISVSYNGAQVSFNYDINSRHLDFTSPLKPGSNTFIINASNNYGSGTKSVNVNYTPINVNSNTGGTNSGEPSYNHGSWNIGTIFNNKGGTTNSHEGNQSPPPRTINNQSPNPVKTNINMNQPIPRTVNPGSGGDSNPGRPSNGGGRTIPK